MNIKIKCVSPYYDLQLKRDVAVGEELTVDPDRAKLLIGKGLAEQVAVDKATTPAPKKVVKAKK